MNAEILQANVARTLHDMEEQTGKKPGGYTSLCRRVVLGALSGESVDFVTPTGINTYNTKGARIELLTDNVVLLGDATVSDALEKLLAAPDEPLDAILAARAYPKDERHIIAIVPTEEPTYYVVDSQQPDALVRMHEVTEVVQYVERRLDTAATTLHVLPTAEERARRDTGKGRRKAVEIGQGSPSQPWQGFLTSGLERVIFYRPHRPSPH